MRGKKPYAYMKCVRCKASDFHYDAGTKLATNKYKCNKCGLITRGNV